MPIAVEFGAVSGLSSQAACMIALRFDADTGFQPSEHESFVCQKYDGKTLTRYGGSGWYTDCWYSPTHKVWVVDSRGEMLYFDDFRNAQAAPQVTTLDASLMGIWGVDDGYIFAWGDTPTGGRMFLFQQGAWREIASPGKGVLALHGLSRDMVYAVGVGGMISKWDGTRWVPQSSPTGTNLSSVFVVSPDEMYAVGPGRRFLEGSVHGWVEAIEANVPLSAVVKWKDEIYVGAGPAGTFKRQGPQLVDWKPKITATKIDARQDFVASAIKHLICSDDPQKFTGVSDAPQVLRIRESRIPAWLK